MDTENTRKSMKEILYANILKIELPPPSPRHGRIGKQKH